MKYSGIPKWVIGALVGFLFLFLLLHYCWPYLWGSHSLGNNLYLLDWESNTKIVVFGKPQNARICNSGSYIIPSGPVSETREYVLDAVSTEKIILVLSYLVVEDRYNYYVISKDFNPINYTSSEIRANNMVTYSDYSSFYGKCDSLDLKSIIPSNWKY